MSSPEFFRTIDFFPQFDATRCSLCLKCVEACGLGVIELVNDGDSKAHLEAKREICRNCRSCIQVCRKDAIRITASLGGKGAGRLKKDQM